MGVNGQTPRVVKSFQLEVEGQVFQVMQFEIPFREGVELETEFNGEKIRISDRQLGEREALRLLELELKKRLQ